MRAALGARVAQADVKLVGFQRVRALFRQKRGQSGNANPLCPLFWRKKALTPYMIGASAVVMRSSCFGESIAPRICRKRSFCTPETMYCQR